MRQSTLAFICGLILCVILALSWCGRKLPTESTSLPAPVSPTVSPTPAPQGASQTPSSTPQTSPTPTPQTPPPEFKRIAQKIEPAVTELTVFDISGQLLRNGTGFFISRDGQILTSASTVEGAAHGVAKSPDGKIRNVSGVIASSPDLDLAVLRADTQTGVAFATLSKRAEVEPGAFLALIGNPLRHQPMVAGTTPMRAEDQISGQIKISSPLPNDSAGCPVVDLTGEVVGVVSSQKAQGTPIIRPASSLDPLIAQVKPSTVPRWAVADETPTPSPKPSVTPRRRVTYNPAPKYPGSARFSGLRGSGRFRVVFAIDGTVKSVQVLQSTGQPILDQAGVEALQHWKAEPGTTEWTILVPITFAP